MASHPYLGVDLGMKRTGLALSENGLLARPLAVLEASPPHMGRVINGLVQAISEHQIATVVIGLPQTADFGPTPQAEKYQKVIQQLRESLAERQIGAEIVTVNEFHSTQDARQYFPDHDPDSGAAALILQDYLDQRSHA